MKNVTTIQLDKQVVEKLKELRAYPRQTYNEILEHLIFLRKNLEIRNQYDEFLHKIQKPKMKELWHNSSDEEWENA